MSRTKLQRLLNRMDGTNQKTVEAIRSFDDSVKNLRTTLEKEITVSTLEEVNTKINTLRKRLNLQPLLDGIAKLDENFKESVTSLLNDIEAKTVEFGSFRKNSEKANQVAFQLESLKGELNNFIQANSTQLTSFETGLKDILKQIKNLASQKAVIDTFEKINQDISDIDKKQEEKIKALQEGLKKLHADMLSAVASRGGSMNRQMYINGVDPLKKWTDINLKAGSNVTITYSDNNATRQVDVTITSSGGGGSVIGGTVRSINSVSTSQTMGNNSGTDYVYIGSAGIALTLPTASSNTNLYTIKNTSTSSIVVIPNGADTIDSQPNVILRTQYTAVDVISDSVNNWNIT